MATQNYGTAPSRNTANAVSAPKKGLLESAPPVKRKKTRKRRTKR